MAETKRFLLHIQLQHFGIERLAVFMPKFQKRLEALTVNKDFKLAYRNPTREVFGYFLRSNLAATQIRARLANEPDAWEIHKQHLSQEAAEPLIYDKDVALVVELGEDFDAKYCGNTAATWLRLHH